MDFDAVRSRLEPSWLGRLFPASAGRVAVVLHPEISPSNVAVELVNRHVAVLDFLCHPSSLLADLN
jgi:hypothetical protein